MNYSTNGTTNTTTDSTHFHGLGQTAEYLRIAAYCLVIVLSLVGNGLVIAIVYKNPNERMRTPNNYFVVNMAVADGLITSVNMVAHVISLANGFSLPFGGIAGTVGCKFQNFMWFYLVSMSSGSLSAIAVDRFLLVFVPLKRIITLRTARVIIITITIIGALASWPSFILSTTIKFEDKTFCYLNMERFRGSQIYILSFLVAFIFFPLLTMFVFYTAISLKLWLRKSPGNQENTERMNRRIVIMLITVVVLFSLCWLPVSSLNFACLLYPSSRICSILATGNTSVMLLFVAFSNSAINPYVYFIFNKNFRHGARVIWSSIRGFSTNLFNRQNRVDVVVEMNPTAVQNQTCYEQETTTQT